MTQVPGRECRVRNPKLESAVEHGCEAADLRQALIQEGRITMQGEGYGPDFKPLVGTSETAMDIKGRILVPQKKRERLGDDFVITLGRSGCLEAYPKVVWDRMVSDILSHESINAGMADFSRLFLGCADDEIDCDKQGRLLIGQWFREIARLSDKDKVILIGCGNRMEIWAKNEYETFMRFPEAYAQERRKAFDAAYARMKGL